MSTSGQEQAYLWCRHTHVLTGIWSHAGFGCLSDVDGPSDVWQLEQKWASTPQEQIRQHSIALIVEFLLRAFINESYGQIEEKFVNAQ